MSNLCPALCLLQLADRGQSSQPQTLQRRPALLCSPSADKDPKACAAPSLPPHPLFPENKKVTATGRLLRCKQVQIVPPHSIKRLGCKHLSGQEQAARHWCNSLQGPISTSSAADMVVGRREELSLRARCCAASWPKPRKLCVNSVRSRSPRERCRSCASPEATSVWYVTCRHKELLPGDLSSCVSSPCRQTQAFQA